MTTITDTFNRADSPTSLGTTSDGSATWTALSGTWGISSNQAYNSSPTGLDVAYINTPAADGTLQVTLPVFSSSGLAFRIQDINNFLMLYVSGGTIRLYRWVGGSATQIGSGFGSFTNGDSLGVTLSGSSITVLHNGSSVGSATETTYQTLTKHGLVLGTASTAPRWDNWSFSYTPPVTLTGTSSRTRGAAATIAVGYVISGTSARARGASASISLSDHLNSTAARARGASAAMTVVVPFVAGSGPGWEANGRIRDASATIDVDDPVLPVSPFHFINTQWLDISGPPTFDPNHQPVSTSWPATEGAGTWGRYRIRIGGKDVTMFRGAVTLISQESYTEPFGDEALILVFPAIPPYEQFGTGALTWLDIDKPVVVEKVDPSGHRSVRFEGDVTSFVDNFDGKTGPLQVECTGFGYTLDNRITKPRQTSDPIECGRFMADLIANEITYGWNGHHLKTSDSGVETAERGGYGDPLLTVTIQNILALLQRGEDTLWTLGVNRPRTLKMLIKSRTTMHFSLWCGQRGVTHQLTQDAKRAIDVIFGQGQDHGTQIWQGWVYPNAEIEPPAYPLPDGVFFNPGDGHTGFDPFSDELVTRGYRLRSGDTYLAADEQHIADFQDDMNIQVDGVVGPQTWNTAFTLALNAHLLDAFIRPLAVDTHAEPFIYNSRGGRAGKNPHYTRKTRREKLEQYGQLSKSDARRSAKLEMPIINVADWAGTVTVTNMDPPELAALDILQGMNFTLHGHRGVDRIFHIARIQHQPGLAAGQDRVTTMTVSERADDYVTLAARLTRDRDVVDQSGRTKPPRRRAKQTPDFAPWDSESGAGYLKPRAQTGGLWNVYPIPAGERGQIVHVRLVANTPTLISAALFNWEISPNHLASLLGLADPSAGAAGGQDPWQYNAAALTVKPFYDDQPWLAWATGGPGAMQGYWPNTPDVGATVTGVLDDASSFPFHARRGKWLFLAVWTRDSCRISGDPAYSYRALWPGADS